MVYLASAFCVVWVCHLVYLLVIDGQARQLRRRLEARWDAAPNQA